MIRQILHRLDAFGKAVGSIEFGVVLESLAGINIRPFAKHFLQRLQHEVANFARHGGLGFGSGAFFSGGNGCCTLPPTGWPTGGFPYTGSAVAQVLERASWSAISTPSVRAAV